MSGFEIARSVQELNDLSPRCQSAPGEAEKVKLKDFARYQELRQDWLADRGFVSDVFDDTRTRILTGQADRWMVGLPALPRGGMGNQFWRRGEAYPDKWFLTREGELEIKRRLREERKARREKWTFWAGVIGMVTGLVGALASLITVWKR